MNLHCTVLIPAYNTESYIGEAITSALGQIYPDFDILVVDDGSTDKTKRVVNRLMPDKPLSLLHYRRNKGLPYALDLGIQNAQGPVITFMGSDDLLLPTSLSVGVLPFEDPELGYLWTNFRFTGGKRGWSRDLPKGTTLWEAICIKGWWRASCQQFFSREWYMKSRRLDTTFLFATDYQLAVRLGETGCQAKHLSTITYVYRYPRPGSISTSNRSKQQSCDRAIRKESVEWMQEKKRKRGTRKKKRREGM